MSMPGDRDTSEKIKESLKPKDNDECPENTEIIGKVRHNP